MGQSLSIYTIALQDEEDIAKSGVSTSAVVDLNDYKPAKATAGLQITLTGSGAAKAEVTVSNDDVTYTETSGGDVATGMAAGTTWAVFTLDVSRYLKVVITETGAANPVVASVTLSLQ